MAINVRHETASGRLDEMWTWVRLEQRIDLLIRRGNLSVPIQVHVCSRGRPIRGAHPIVRVDGESWRVLAERYVCVYPNGIPRLTTVPCPISEELAIGEQLVLTNTPPAIDEELEAL